MDEGFTSYISDLAENEILEKNLSHPSEGSYKSYISMALSGKEQPLSTHADRYDLNRLYGTSAYSKGSVFLAQLGYVIGEENLKKAIKHYFKEWSFKHPKPYSIIRSAEKVSDIELDWYLMDFAQTTNRIDYGVSRVGERNGNATVSLRRVGLMPMPIDLTVEFVDGSKASYYIPLLMMRGEKPVGDNITVLKDWAWANPSYTFSIDRPRSEIKSVTIDPENKMADVNKYNNRL
jgi:aminopeptidase N